ncbi:copper radical oxidase [Lactarius tabidus]
MGYFYHNILSTAFTAFCAIPTRAVYLALDAAAEATANFEVIGTSLVSAQQLFLGTIMMDKVYIVDKMENNPTPIMTGWDATGNVLGNGTWVNVGGNQAVTYCGASALTQNGLGDLPYNDPDRGQSFLNPCDDNNCDWILAGTLTTRRWYLSVETTLEDGCLIIATMLSSDRRVPVGGFSNPTYGFLPSRGKPVTSPFLTNTIPLNLYPFTFLLSSGRLLVQANWQTAAFDHRQGLGETYPASADLVMMPLTSANNWTAIIMFCGGNIGTNYTRLFVLHTNHSRRLNSYTHVDSLPEGRTMGNIILLPTGQVLCLNGAGTGVVGYGNDSWAIGQSFADRPILQLVLYNSPAPAGSQWPCDGLSASAIPRMYHSTATLLPDSSVIVTGSNPNSDYISTLAYLIQPSINLGHLLVGLEVSSTANADSSGILHCSNLPPNTAIFRPGSAFLFVVVNGVPSVGNLVDVLPHTPLPAPFIAE